MSLIRGAMVYPIAVRRGYRYILLGRENFYELSYSEKEKYEGFGGKCTRDENPVDCAAREIYEELNCLCYDINQWKNVLNNKLRTRLLVERTKGQNTNYEIFSYFPLVKFDTRLPKIFNQTKNLINIVSEKYKISNENFIKSGLNEKIDIRWFSEDCITELLRGENIRTNAKNIIPKFFSEKNLF